MGLGLIVGPKACGGPCCRGTCNPPYVALVYSSDEDPWPKDSALVTSMNVPANGKSQTEKERKKLFAFSATGKAAVRAYHLWGHLSPNELSQPLEDDLPERRLTRAVADAMQGLAGKTEIPGELGDGDHVVTRGTYCNASLISSLSFRIWMMSVC